MNWIKYILISISTLAMVCSEQIIIACGDYSYDDNPVFFGKKGNDQLAFSPFYYDEYYLYYENEWLADSINKAKILLEWQDYFGKSIPLKDIDALIYQGEVSLFEGLKNGQINDALYKGNALVSLLLDKKHSPTLDYLWFAKKCEANAMKNHQGWYSEEQSAKAEYNNIALKEEGLKAFKKEKNDFLKMKYAFQVVRIDFYEKNNEEVLQFYDQHIHKKEEKSVAFTRIVGFKAGAHFRKKEMGKAAYYYAKMFDSHDAYKFEAMVSFEWSKEGDSRTQEQWMKEVLSYCKNDHEKAVVLVMRGLRVYDDFETLDLMKEAYRSDPNIDGLKVLMNREINKAESRYYDVKFQNTNQVLHTSQSTYNEVNFVKVEERMVKYEAYMKGLQSFADQIIANKNISDKAFWHLSKAYLYSLQDQTQLMKKHLDLAHQSGMNPSEQSLYNMIDLLHDFYSVKEIDAKVEAKILPKLKQLDRLAEKDQIAGRQFGDFMYYLLAGQYFYQGDTIKGVYAMGHAYSWDVKRETYWSSTYFDDVQGGILNQMSIPDLKKIQAFRSSKQKSPFENWLVEGAIYTTDVLKELEGTKLLRVQNFKEAAAVFKDVENLTEYPNPFMPQINDYVEVYEKDLLRKYTKYTFSKRMAELKEIIENDPQDAGAMYGYAVALYNISYYGKMSSMSMYYRSYTDGNGYFLSKNEDLFPADIKDYYRVYTAEKYFKKTADATTDPEVKAKALWGAAKCWTKRAPSSNAYGYTLEEEYFFNALKNPYFKTLHRNLSQTKFLKEVEKTCDYYESYVWSNK